MINENPNHIHLYTSPPTRIGTERETEVLPFACLLRAISPFLVDPGVFQVSREKFSSLLYPSTHSIFGSL